MVLRRVATVAARAGSEAHSVQRLWHAVRRLAQRHEPLCPLTVTLHLARQPTPGFFACLSFGPVASSACAVTSLS